MPRKISGLGGGSRIPIRGLANLLNNLPGEAAESLRGAFEEAEDLLNFYDQSVRDKQNKRKLSSLLDAPVLTVTQSVLGASVKFDRLSDPRISFYELQVDDVNTFPDPDSFQVVDPFFALDGITTIKHIRCRAVRGVTGECGNWSNTVTARPTLTAPTAYSWQFYQRYTGAEPNLFKKKRYSGEDFGQFYTLFETSFYANRLIGGLSVWGMVSNRLKKPLNSNVRPWDRVRFQINGITRMENYFPLWTNSFFDDDTPNINPVNNRPMSFYGLGGYTASFGPYNIAVPVTEHGHGPQDPNAFDDIDAPGTGFYWFDETLLCRPDRLDTGQLDNFDDFDHKGREAEVGIGRDGLSSYLVAKKFKFSIPDDEQVQGIEVKVKRRQLNYPAVPRDLLPLQHEAKRSVTGSVQFDYGKNPNKRLLESNYNQSNTLTPAIELSDVKTDVEYGRFVETFGQTDTVPNDIDYLGTAGRIALPAFPPQVGTTDAFNTFIGTNSWTIATWINPYFSTMTDGIEGIWGYDAYNNTLGAITRTLRLRRGRIPVGASNEPQYLQIEAGGFGARQQNYNNIFLTVNSWYFLVVRYNGGASFDVSVNSGLIRTPTTTVGVAFPGFTANNQTFGGTFNLYGNSGGFASGLGVLNGGRGQTAIWNKYLTNEELNELVQLKFNGDYRYNQGDYESAANLMHYWLFLPEEPQIQDFDIRLHDASGIRFDLDNKAQVGLWPKLDDFFYQVNFSPDGQLLASSQGIPHDNTIGIGPQSYGSEFDLWGLSPQPNSYYQNEEFGVALRAMNGERAFPGVGYVDHIKMTLFTKKPDQTITVRVQAQAANQFYTEREVFGGLFNAVETGEIPLSILP